MPPSNRWATSPKPYRDSWMASATGKKHQVLLGATGTGKTFTIASVIQQVQKPALIMARNKTLAAQLYAEFKEFFPSNAVSYFVSYYDYYQPEACVPRHDLYIEKETEINEEIERLRLAATPRSSGARDVIIVASVSCIYGLGSPEEFGKGTVVLQVGELYRRNALLRQLIKSQYQRNDMELRPGTLRVRGDTLEIIPAYEDKKGYRITFFGDEVELHNAFHFIAEESDAVSLLVLISRDDFECITAHPECSRAKLHVITLVLRFNQLAEQGVAPI